jgi:thioredoxin 1
MTELNSKTFEQNIIKGKVVIDFYATWCGPCQMLAPIMEEVSKEITDVTFYKVNVDNSNSLAQKFNVQSIPTIYFLNNGKIVSYFQGFRPKAEVIK